MSATAATTETKLHMLDFVRILRQKWHLILLTFLLSLGVAIVITNITPKEYKSSVEFRLDFEKYMAQVTLRGSSNTANGPVNQVMFIEDEFHALTSQKVLDAVVDELELVSRWNLTSKSEARDQLLASVKLRTLRQSSTFNVEVYDGDPDLAANIANKMAQVYTDQRVSRDRGEYEAALAVFDTKIAELEKEVEEAREAVAEIEKLYDVVMINNPNLDSGGTNREIVERSDLERQDALKNLIEKKKELSTQKSMLDGIIALEALNDVENMAARLGNTYEAVGRKREVISTLKANIINLSTEGIGRKHREMVGANLQLEQAQTELASAVKDAMVDLRGKLKSNELDVDKLQTKSDDLEIKSKEKKGVFVELRAGYDKLDTKKNEVKYMKENQTALMLQEPLVKPPTIINNFAEASKIPVKPRPMLNMILGGLLGIIFGVLLAFMLEFVDNSVRNIEDVEKLLNTNVLAVIPKDVGILHKQSGLSPDAEAYRILRTNIEFNRKSADSNSICVVSGGAGEGKSTTLVNLAYVCAQGGYTTLIIDADLRRPKMHTFFDINNSVGLTNYLTTDVRLEDVILQTPIDNLFFLPSGILPADAAGILNSQRMSQLIQDVKSRFDLVLLDSPPILGVSDASVICSEVDLTMVVIQHRKLPKPILSRVKQAVENVGGNLVGVVLNNVDVRGDTQYQYYTSYYTYYSPTQRRASSNTALPEQADASTREHGDRPDEVANLFSRGDNHHS